MRVEKLIANVRSPHLSREQQREQLDLLAGLNRHHLRQRDGDAQLEAQIQTMETAFRMQREAMETFDVSREPQSVREKYGDSNFARSCLLARRLVEAGVRFVTVYYTSSDNQPWDTHADHDARHRKLCADGDRASSGRHDIVRGRRQGFRGARRNLRAGDLHARARARRRVARRDHLDRVAAILRRGGGTTARSERLQRPLEQRRIQAARARTRPRRG